MQSRKEDSVFSGAYSPQVFKAVMWAYKPWRGWFGAALITGLIARTLLLANANIMGFWIDSFCTTKCKPVPALFAGLNNHDFAAILVGMASVGFLLNALFRITVSRVGTLAVSRFYDAVTFKTSKFPMFFFDAHPVGRMITRFSSDYSAMFRMAGGPMGEFLCLLFDLILMMILSAVASPWFLPLVLLSLYVNYRIYKRNINFIRTSRRDLSRARSPSIAHFSETAQGTKIIKAYCREQSFTERFEALIDIFAVARMNSTITAQAFSLQLVVSVAVMLLITGISGFVLLHLGFVSIGALGVAITFVMSSSVTMQLFFDWLSSVEEALTGVERMNEYMQHEIEPLDVYKQNENFINDEKSLAAFVKENGLVQSKHDNISAELHVTDLSLRYNNNLPLILKDVSFTVKPGEHIGIIGKTGAGKSSIIQAIFYLYKFEKGNISLGGYSPLASPNSPNCISLSDYRNLFSLIPQDPTLFMGTLKANLDPWNKFSNKELIAVLESAGLGEFLRGLGDNPLSHYVEEKGANLSIGQRQLVCIARSLLIDSPVVLFDEATSAVDPVSESLLIKTTEKHFKHKTRLTIAHRLSTVEHCSRILWLEQGTVVLFDTPEIVIPRFSSTDLK